VELGADAAITADRYELTYLVPRAHWSELARCFDERLPAHHYRGEGRNSLPSPEHFVTTVYFDTPTQRLLRQARTSGVDSLKLRAKEYYDLHPSLAELATRVEDVVHAPGQLWLELKRRSGARTQKHRVRLSKSDLWRCVQERTGLAASEYVGREMDARVLKEYLASEPEPLAPACMVNYRRSSWQSDDGQLRLTLDANLAFFAPPAELFRRRSLLREQLGPPSALEARALLEVKHRAPALPDWLSARLAALGLGPCDYSKFVQASSAVAVAAGAMRDV
jgi:hypothetical protein